MTEQKKQYQFETQVDQLLDLVINSLYGNAEVFLRELVSNASDANDKLRISALENEKLYEGDQNLAIHITMDEQKKTLTIEDNGIGMTEKEIIANIGTIANSGTKKFIEKLSKNKSDPSNLIGQFGVGFYSSFIVAKTVTLITQKAGKATGFKWVSSGKANFTIEPFKKEKKGTQIILSLKDEHAEFLNPYKIRGVVKKYSNHVHFPIYMHKIDSENKEEGVTKFLDEFEQINDTKAMWSKPKKEITEEEYENFYKNTFLDYEKPQTHLHNHVEGVSEYTSLFYIPSVQPFDLWDPKKKHGIKLFVKRVFIMEHKELLPNYLRFVRGLIDSADLPLNVSREILQDNPLIKKIRSASVSKILKYCQDLSKDEEAYQKFWNNFGVVLKEGVVEDMDNKESISALLRFSHLQNDNAIGLEQYIEKMDSKQDEIFYLLGASKDAVKSSPHLEIFKAKNIDVLFMTDPVDEWVTTQLTEYKGKKLVSITKEDVDFSKMDGKDSASESDKNKETTDDSENNEILKLFKEHLQDKVSDVRASKRLTESTSCLVAAKNQMGENMQKVLQSIGQSAPNTKPILEINLDHKIIKNITNYNDDQKNNWVDIVHAQAQLTSNGNLDNPKDFVEKMNQLFD